MADLLNKGVVSWTSARVATADVKLSQNREDNMPESPIFTVLLVTCKKITQREARRKSLLPLGIIQTANR